MQTVNRKRERGLIALAIVICYLFAFLNVGVAVSRWHKRNTVKPVEQVFYRDDFDELDPRDAVESSILEAIAYASQYERDGVILHSVTVFYADKEIMFDFDDVSQNGQAAVQQTAQQLHQGLEKILLSENNTFTLRRNAQYKPIIIIYNFESSSRIIVSAEGRVSVY